MTPAPRMLDELVQRAAMRNGADIALRDAKEGWSYRLLDETANRLAHLLCDLGVRGDDRVALWLDKSALTVAAMQATLRRGAAYVPVDPSSPERRAALVLADCEPRVIITTAERAERLRAAGVAGVRWLIVDGEAGADGAGAAALGSAPTHPLPTAPRHEHRMAYILYTSGSTGKPKGVCISHRNALAFVEWGARTLQLGPDDRLANHAPFQFDLSVFDLYSAFFAGASTTIIPEATSARGLVQLLSNSELTIWYSVPSALIRMMEFGGLLDQSPGRLRAILFAGEVFPVKYLRLLRQSWPAVRLLNLYGPTETNVCTFYEVRDVGGKPIPIGRECCGNRVWARTATGQEARPNEEGELIVEGPTVMLGYHGQSPVGCAPYATGDVVRLLPDGNFEFFGRKDHLVKVRGFRVELGEVEAALLSHDAVLDAAVVALGDSHDKRLAAFVALKPGCHWSLLAAKTHLSERLPHYMSIDSLKVVPVLPRTVNGKLDRERLLGQLAAAS